MEIVYIIITLLFMTILIVGSIIYGHLTTKKMLSKIEHEIKNDKAIQEVLKNYLELQFALSSYTRNVKKN